MNLEYLATVVAEREVDGGTMLLPDTLVGTDSHTTMINGIGILGWGVGGIEAEAGMLGQPLYFVTPQVVGVHMTGQLQEGVTATDLALRVTELLRQNNVVGKFVEYLDREHKRCLFLTEQQYQICRLNMVRRWDILRWMKKH